MPSHSQSCCTLDSTSMVDSLGRSCRLFPEPLAARDSPVSVAGVAASSKFYSASLGRSAITKVMNWSSSLPLGDCSLPLPKNVSSSSRKACESSAENPMTVWASERLLPPSAMMTLSPDEDEVENNFFLHKNAFFSKEPRSTEGRFRQSAGHMVVVF